MQISLKLLLLTASLSILSGEAIASEAIGINPTSKTPLFDGHCDKEEWQASTKIELPAQTAIYLMHDKESLFVCAKGKAEDYTAIDLYIEHAETGHLYNLHASAQLSERTLSDKDWSESAFWNHKDWSGYWVPYAGEEETDEGKRTKFLEGSHREVQVLRKKFVGNTWNMMIRLSAVYQDGEYGAEFFYPEKAADTEKSTWAKFFFSK
ncbi:hypothetical protein [Kangiella koreensis]|uniref:Carbohydrate-binding domain-containing protein n=1 Tax=Kangiella koreensis (strain DSM 16069 / JCM 12317 / KCTC 12182 / SW-125) TaxID=523791 RepID=C7R672_KANKD|nr:hypothetical protein [Kangiella koreensis]ACV25503.1 hypothetical protein Kkor_0081 [Kangiella koreensis DSM 16069]